MRLPRVRFTVRRMMVAVAVVAVIASQVEQRERFKFRRVGTAHHLLA